VWPDLRPAVDLVGPRPVEGVPIRLHTLPVHTDRCIQALHPGAIGTRLVQAQATHPAVAHRDHLVHRAGRRPDPGPISRHRPDRLCPNYRNSRSVCRALLVRRVLVATPVRPDRLITVVPAVDPGLRRRPDRRGLAVIARTCADHHLLCQDRWALEGEKFIIFHWTVWNARNLCWSSGRNSTKLTSSQWKGGDWLWPCVPVC